MFFQFMPLAYVLIGVALLFVSRTSLLLGLFGLEVLFFSFIFSFIYCMGTLLLFLSLLLIIFSGVLGLCLFINVINQFGSELSSSFLDYTFWEIKSNSFSNYLFQSN